MLTLHMYIKPYGYCNMLLPHLALLGASLLSPTPMHMRRSMPRMGLLDWMLDTSFLNPLDKLCRPEGWDCICRLRTSTVHETAGPRVNSALVSVGLRFTHASDAATKSSANAGPCGTVSLTAPSKAFDDCKPAGTWRTTEMAEDGQSPAAIEWRLRAGPSGIGQVLVAPHTELHFAMRVASAAEDGALLSNGRIWLSDVAEGEGGAAPELGTVEAVPNPLAASN